MRDSELIVAIKVELFRLRARPEDVGPLEAISVAGRGQGKASLSAASHPDFAYSGAATKILMRLRGLPDAGGPEVIRSEFGRGH